jgi:hypothetical protein
MPQRVEVLEKRVEDHTKLFTDIREGLRRFEVRVDARFAGIDARFAALETKVDARFVALEQKVEVRFAALEQKFDTRLGALDQKVDGGLARLDHKIDGLRHDMTTHFRWTVGLMITCLASIVAGMSAILAAVVR